MKLDDLQVTTEMLLALLKDRQEGCCTWHEFLKERLTEMRAHMDGYFAPKDSKNSHESCKDFVENAESEFDFDKNCPGNDAVNDCEACARFAEGVQYGPGGVIQKDPRNSHTPPFIRTP